MLWTFGFQINKYMLFTGWKVRGLNILQQTSTSRGEPEAKQHRAFFIKRIYENFGKSLAIFINFWKSSETVQKCFPSFLGFFKIIGKSSEAFGNLRKFSENFGDGSKVIYRCFYDFLKFWEIFGNFWKTSETVQK